MEIVETNVTPRQGGLSGYMVQFVCKDGRRVSVALDDEVPGQFDERALVAKARAMLDAGGIRDGVPSYAASNQNDVRAEIHEQQPISREHHPGQPEGPVPPANPLLEGESDSETHIVPVKNEGMIEP